jgi:LPS export ABC transporter protein LptC
MITTLSKPTERPMSFAQKIYWFADFSMAYLPLVMLCLLFFFSVWLVRSMPETTTDPSQQLTAHTIDYDFSEFTLKSYEVNGTIKSSLHGQKAQHYVDTKHTEVLAPFVYMYAKNQITTAQAKKAVVNEDGTEVQLWGKTLIKRVDTQKKDEEMQISGEFLQFFTRSDTIVSHLPVDISKGMNKFKGNEMRADNKNQTYVLQGRVSATLAPNP